MLAHRPWQFRYATRLFHSRRWYRFIDKSQIRSVPPSLALSFYCDDTNHRPTKNTIPIPPHCWHCGLPVDSGNYFCQCGKIQPLNESWSLFDALGYDGPLIRIDPGDLSLRFHRMQKLLHPDKFVKASEYEQKLAGEASSFVNHAYVTLMRPVDRFAYILSFYQFRDSDFPSDTDPGLLCELIAINEGIHTVTEQLRAGVPQSEVDSIRDEVGALVARISDGLTVHRNCVVRSLEESKFRDAHAALIRYRYYLRARDQLREWNSVLSDTGVHIHFPPD